MIRRALWIGGAPVRWLLTCGVRFYRATLSGVYGGQCRFYPSCSAYADEAIRTRGAVRGSALALWRLFRCNPFGGGGIEHVGNRGKYDDLIHRGPR